MQKAGVNNPGFFVGKRTLKPVEKTPQICYSTGMENSRLECCANSRRNIRWNHPIAI